VNSYIAQQRAQFKAELLNQPTRDEIAAMLVSEDENNPAPVLESLVNRTLFLKSHGIDKTLHQMLHSGFYGPINRGKLPRFVAEVQNDQRLRQKMYSAIDTVLDGSDFIRGHTDQGMTTDPGGKYEMAHSHVMIGGEVFGDWGGGPGSYNGAAAWREGFEARAYAPVAQMTQAPQQSSDGSSPAGYPVPTTAAVRNAGLTEQQQAVTSEKGGDLMSVYLWVSTGQFGKLADPPAGIQSLVNRCKAIHVNVMHSPYQWFQLTQIVSEVKNVVRLDPHARIVIGGASLGSNEALAIAKALEPDKVTVHLLFGFQRSRFGRQYTVPANVDRAIDIHDPNIITDPFGDDPWVAEPGNKHTVIEPHIIDAPHPGDYGPGQDIVFAAIQKPLAVTQKSP
jgi:hypothetical protein